eukprot:2866291-Prymnesium_polylepis.1
MSEQTERVTIHSHKSFLFHGAVYKVSRDILKVGDVGATDLSALELQNADTKRTATTGASKHLKILTGGQMITPQMTVRQGPSNLIKTRGYCTTMARSTLLKLVGKKYLREGHGIQSLAASRRKERLFGEKGSGRSKAGRAASAKLELLGSDYNPREDTSLKAFVRFIAAVADAEHESQCIGCLLYTSPSPRDAHES